MTANLLLVFWFHLTGDILYHRNLLTKRSFFVFFNPYLFFGACLVQGEFIPPGKQKRIHLLQAELDSRLQMSYRGASLYFIWG